MRRLSPFAQLLRFVEGALFDLALELQLPAPERNLDFMLGYRTALNIVLEQAYAIYNRRFPGELALLDERTEEATERLLAALKKRGE